MRNEHVFLSYCHDNTVLATRLHDALERAGEVVCWDRDFTVGPDWKDQRDKALDCAYAMVLCWSKQAASRTESGVYPELRDAIERLRDMRPGECYILPVRLNKADLPRLRIDATTKVNQLQYVDLFPATKWALGVQRVLESLRASARHP